MRKKIDYKHLIEDVCSFKCENDNYSKPMPSLKAQEALNELCDYFLGDDWYEPTGQTHPEIVNFAIVEEIEKRYRGAKIKRNRRAKNENNWGDRIWGTVNGQGSNLLGFILMKVREHLKEVHSNEEP